MFQSQIIGKLIMVYQASSIYSFGSFQMILKCITMQEKIIDYHKI